MGPLTFVLFKTLLFQSMLEDSFFLFDNLAGQILPIKKETGNRRNLCVLYSFNQNISMGSFMP